MMLVDTGGDQLAKMGVKSPPCALFVFAHEPRIADNVSREDGS